MNICTKLLQLIQFNSYFAIRLRGYMSIYYYRTKNVMTNKTPYDVKNKKKYDSYMFVNDNVLDNIKSKDFNEWEDVIDLNEFGLNEEEFNIFEKYINNDKDVIEIANELNRSREWVYKIMRRGKMKIKNNLIYGN